MLYNSALAFACVTGMKKTLVVIPTYNEANNLPMMVAELFGLELNGLEILVVDDDSPDGTGDIADSLAEQHPDKIHVMHRKIKEGLGRAYIAGFTWALSKDYDYIIQMDADFSHSPSHIPEMLEAIQNYDVVIGSRYVDGGEIDNRWEFGRYLLSWWANAIYTKLILNLDVKDGTAGFKCWRSETLRGIDLQKIGSQGYSFQYEMAFVTQKLGYSAKEIPIYFEDRRIGKSKLTVPIKIEAAMRIWSVVWQYRKLTPENRLTEKD